jgi:hypothetical protein
MNKTVLFISINYRIQNSTFLVSIPRLLNERGLNSVIVTNTEFSISNYNQHYLKVLQLSNLNYESKNRDETSRYKLNKKNSFLFDLKRYFYNYKKEYIKYKELVKYSISIKEYIIENNLDVSCICSIEPDSLFIGSILNKNRKYGFCYNSMEISHWEQTKLFVIKKIINFIFKNNISNVDLITIQDSDRKKYFLEKIKTKVPIEILPVGIDGDTNKIKSDYLRKKFQIENDKFIILYSGSITSWACVHEIIKTAIDWANDKSLVINGWISNLEYYEKLKEVSKLSKNIYINTEPVKWEDLDNLVASADIGLAIYRDSDLNCQAISSSSNKLAVYSKSGIPVIINDTFSTKAMFEKHKWGESVGDIVEIEEKINCILEDIESYKRNAFNAFNAYYNLKILSKDFLDYLTSH